MSDKKQQLSMFVCGDGKLNGKTIERRYELQ